MNRSLVTLGLLMGSLASSVSGLTVQTDVTDGTMKCDAVLWTDAQGRERKCLLINDQQTDPNLICGGYVDYATWNNGSQVITASSCTDGSGGFGLTIHHGNWPVRAWLNSKTDGYDSHSGFIFVGDHHAIWKHVCKIGSDGYNTAPYINQYLLFVFRDGEDHWQQARTSDCRHLKPGDLPSSDSRSPYNSCVWYAAPGDSWDYMPKCNFGYGTTNKIVADPNAMTYTGTEAYNLCPYNESWWTGDSHDNEIGDVQTRLQTRHKAGRGSGANGMNGAITTADQFDFQFSDYQGWYGGRICWQAAGPSGIGAIGVTPGTENYSLSVIVDRRSTGGVARLVSEANAIMNSGTTLTASIGSVVTDGPEAAGLNLLTTWDKPGFDQVLRNWVVKAQDNCATMILAVQSGQTLKNPTFVLANYTAPGKPAGVSAAGQSLTEGSGYYASVDTTNQQLWLTVLRDVTGSVSVSVTGPADPVTAAISAFTAGPALIGKNGGSITFSATVTGATEVHLDLSSLGGPSSVAMAGSGTAYAYTFAAGPQLDGNAIVTLIAQSAGGRRTAVTGVMVKDPDIIMYTDSISRLSLPSPNWAVSGGTLSEVSTGAYEGAKCLKFAYTQSGSTFYLGFDSAVDLRRYKYLVLAYKGLNAGQTLNLQIRCWENCGQGNYPLPPSSSGYTEAALSIADVMASGGSGEYLSLDSVGGLTWHVMGTNSAGTVLLDKIYFTNVPGAGDPIEPPTAIKSFLPACTKGHMTVTAAGRGVLLKFGDGTLGTVRIHDLQGRLAGSFTKRNAAAQMVRLALTPGTYSAVFRMGAQQSTTRFVIR